jgi:small subunit ribosomal protein S16
MSTIIKLQRQGAPHKPFWRIAVTDSRKPGGCLELVGTYDNRHKPAAVSLQADKIAAWLVKGAVPTPTVKRIFLNNGIVAQAKTAQKAGAKA